MLFCHRQVFGNKDGNPTLIPSSNSDNENPNNFFARVGAQVARRNGGTTDIPQREGAASSLPVTPQHEDAASSSPVILQREGAASSSPVTLQHEDAASSSPVTPQREDAPPSSPVTPQREDATPSSPVTPQHEDSDEEIGCHPKLSRTRNLGTNVSINV